MWRLFGMMVAVGLVGCTSEADERAALAHLSTEGCVAGFAELAAERGGAAAGADGRRFCDCVIEKTFAGKDIRQLREMTRREPNAQENALMASCVAEEARRGGPLGK